jgi:hypothetical protein
MNKEELEELANELKLDPDLAEHAEEIADALHELGIEVTDNE